tara:strand:+ start:46 stop:318 length:273 start_codon:yes stop_codon:yes gene_type:complete
MKIITIGVLLRKPLRSNTIRRENIIINFGFPGKKSIKFRTKLSNTLVFTTPCPSINKLRTLINVVLLNPDRIIDGLIKLIPLSSTKGKIV